MTKTITMATTANRAHKMYQMAPYWPRRICADNQVAAHSTLNRMWTRNLLGWLLPVLFCWENFLRNFFWCNWKNELKYGKHNFCCYVCRMMYLQLNMPYFLLVEPWIYCCLISSDYPDDTGSTYTSEFPHPPSSRGSFGDASALSAPQSAKFVPAEPTASAFARLSCWC